MAEERVQRRLAAILAADVVGYSRLIEADEEGTRARLRSLHSELIYPRVEADGGRIVKTTGDGVLVEFPSAIDAVRNALAIQGEMRRRNADLPEERRIAFRVGINVGDVIVESDDIHGEGVNVAARLEGLAEPGEVYVSGTVCDHAAGKLDAVFEDLGEHTVKNMSRPVRVYRVQPNTKRAPAEHEGDAVLPLADKPSIAVLPFANMSGDPEQEYFSDGITEDLITALSRIHWFFVTARNSSFSYKGQSPDIRQVADDLGVRYVLEGSVRKSRSRVRITVQLINGTSGNHVWAERYDRELEDVFELQDEITEKIVGAIEPAITKAEIQRSRSKRPDNLDAWDLCQRGWFHRYRYRQKDFAEARQFFECALEADPEFVSALAGLTEVLSYEIVFSFAEDPQVQVKQAIAYGRQGVAIDDEDPIAHLALGRAYAVGEQYENAISTFGKALQLNPFFAAAHAALGGVYIVMGRLEEGIDTTRKAIALSPQDIMMGAIVSRLAQAYLARKDYEKAAQYAEEAFRCPMPPQWPGKSYLVSALGHLGGEALARQALEELLQMRPGITLSWIRSQPFHIAMGRGAVDDYLDGLRKAGLAE
jgi:adenylate cyclase